jgi:hypothetical protein
MFSDSVTWSGNLVCIVRYFLISYFYLYTYTYSNYFGPFRIPITPVKCPLFSKWWEIHLCFVSYYFPFNRPLNVSLFHMIL